VKKTRSGTHKKPDHRTKRKEGVYNIEGEESWNGQIPEAAGVRAVFRHSQLNFERSGGGSGGREKTTKKRGERESGKNHLIQSWEFGSAGLRGRLTAGKEGKGFEWEKKRKPRGGEKEGFNLHLGKTGGLRTDGFGPRTATIHPAFPDSQHLKRGEKRSKTKNQRRSKWGGVLIECLRCGASVAAPVPTIAQERADGGAQKF